MKNKTTVHINAQIAWAYYRTKNGNWIADCVPLGLTVQSGRYSELAEDISDTLDLLFRDLLRSDELDRFLEVHGWTREMDSLSSEAAGDAVFDVPFELLRAGRDGSASSLHQ